MTSPTFSNSNPNSFGGSFNYDSRTGLSIGSLGGDPNSGIGRNWNMGDALSSPKGEYDYEIPEDKQEIIQITSNTTVRELAILAGLIETEADNPYDELDADIESKAHTSFQRRATDSLAHRGTDISSLGGLGNSIAGVIGLSAGYEVKGNKLLENSLKEYIEELILSERGNQISGNIVVRSTGKDSIYKNMNVSTNTADAAPVGHLPKGRHGFNYKGHDQEEINVYIKTPHGHVKVPMKGTTDGAETVKSSSSEILIDDFYDEDLSSFDILLQTTNQNFNDKYNVLNKNKKL
jgi:hypothetical protein